MPFCHNCGAKLEPGDVFCIECGTKSKEFLSDADKSQVVTADSEKEEVVLSFESVVEPNPEPEADKTMVMPSISEQVLKNTSEPETEDKAVQIPAIEPIVESQPEAENEGIGFCRECGKERRPDSLFCPSCGKRYDKTLEPDITTKVVAEEKPVIEEIPVSDIAILPAVAPVLNEETVPEIDIEQVSVSDDHSSEYHEFKLPEEEILTKPTEHKQTAMDPDFPVESADKTVSSNKKTFPVVPVIVAAATVVVIGSVIAFIATGPSRKYKKAEKLYDSGDYAAAVSCFEAAGNYKDAKSRAQDANLRMHYKNGKDAFDSGDFNKAKDEFAQAGSFSDAEEMVRESDMALHYAKGVNLCGSGDYASAVEEFKIADGYKDSLEQVKKCFYQLGEDAASKNNYDDAINYYTKAGDYQDAAEKAPELNYKHAESELAAGNILNAVKYFEQAGDHKDAAERAKAIYYDLGTDALNKNDYDNAAEYLKKAGDYKDAVSKGQIAYYNKAVSLLNKKDYDSAGEYLKLAGNYKDAKDLLIKTISTLIKDNDYDNAKKLVMHYAGDDSVKYSSYIDGMIAYNSKDYEEAAKSFKASGSFLNSKDLYNASAYNLGLNLLTKGSYSEAGSLFKELGKYKSSVSLVNVCDAEAQYKAGKYAKAAQLYSKVSTKIKVSGFDIQRRRTHVIAKSTLEKIKGEWKASTQNASVKHFLTYSYEWKNNTILGGEHVSLSYTENNNGSFNISIVVSYGRYDKDTGKFLLHANEIYLKNQKSFPSTIKVDNYTKLQYKSGTFKLIYAEDYKDTYNNSVKYGTTTTYKKK